MAIVCMDVMLRSAEASGVHTSPVQTELVSRAVGCSQQPCADGAAPEWMACSFLFSREGALALHLHANIWELWSR